MSACVLALEWSSRRVSVAVRMAGGNPLERVEWMARFHAPAAMALVMQTLADSGCGAQDVTEIRVGRGPGNFSGIRSAFAWAAGMTAPGGVDLVPISSGRALAQRLTAEEEDRSFAVLGDARRGFWWGGVYVSGTSEEVLWEIQPPALWMDRCQGMTVYSTEAPRLKGLEGVREAWPSACDLLEWTGAVEPGAPLYFHPPV